ncbi:thiamine phosphate synthase [Aliarcobacter thereius]|uniref:Regulatory protein TenI n=2 Tax=Aliarcobacter thereius TaxID=544718 RepID=A0A1C0B9Q0_9BACT|nr:thiamine phosphate synthase [Aliarcobacter thereius]OCL92025.1 Regulatory protein TenI [Aliarcobacter thereius]OCL94879.1 Regulatory protein TenI [Aliarcobacter thereius LMG 24486]OCM00326.1 Regulatory protein TenI [Aliarcobacter thereius]QBF15247.1 thiamine phosphate synthase [Aliarcobacter thereius LMG 24486]TLS91986.1 thiamine phosphate synthase [Aliarcobacter thereius]
MIVFVTSRNLCKDDFLNRIEKLCSSNPDILILREKDMDFGSYLFLAKKVKDICKKYEISFYINSKIDVAKKLGIKNIQIGFDDFLKYKRSLEDFENIIVSIHSLDEVKTLQNENIKYIIAGHIFETACKKGLEPRGLEFLKELCKNSQIPILGIGGIDKNNYKQVLENGAKGFCIMSEIMQTENPETVKQVYKN